MANFWTKCYQSFFLFIVLWNWRGKEADHYCTWLKNCIIFHSNACRLCHYEISWFRCILTSYRSLTGRCIRLFVTLKPRRRLDPKGFIVSSTSFLPLNSCQLLPVFTTQRFVRASFLLSLRARLSTPSPMWPLPSASRTMWGKSLSHTSSLKCWRASY